MNAKFAFRFIREYQTARTKNRNSESKRQALIHQMKAPKPLTPAHTSQSLNAFPTTVQLFNEWKYDDVRFAILERSHPRLLKKLKQRHGWHGVVQNHSGAAVAWTGKMEKVRTMDRPKLAITSTVLGGWDAVSQWHAHYSKSEVDLEFLLYVNAPVAPARFIDECASLKNVHLIPWDFPYSRFKHHYLGSYKAGHAQPTAIADAKYRALSLDCSHLLPIDMDEFIHPIEQLDVGLRDKPCYFLSSFAKNPNGGVGLLSGSLHSNPEASQNHIQGEHGTSGVLNKHAYGKCISPLHWDAHIPDIHCSGITSEADLDIHPSAIMLHFIEQEGQRTLPEAAPLVDLQLTDIAVFIREHRELSDGETYQYALQSPKQQA